MDNNHKAKEPKPSWMKKRFFSGTTNRMVRSILKRNELHTICEEGRCPNLGQCYSNGTAAFLILGKYCTRKCLFCAVKHEPPMQPDPMEPSRVAHAVKSLGLSYIVITSVTRDDLTDGGAAHFAETIKEIHRSTPEVCVEVLIPDFKGSVESLRTVIEAKPEVISHNLETVPRIYQIVRPNAHYYRSLDLLKWIRIITPDIIIKSSLMLGMGEFANEIRKVIKDLVEAECKILTFGQYLQPSRDQLPVVRYIPLEEFDMWRKTALEMGIQAVISGPYVRSSFNAGEAYEVLNTLMRKSCDHDV